MITAIIRNKENTLVLELPHSIYDIYEKLRSIGIMQPPKQISLTDNEDEDIGVKLFSESDFGRHLLLTLNEKNSIADANMLTLVIGAASEDIKEELEQNILYDQYDSMDEVINAVRQMTQDAGPVKAGRGDCVPADGGHGLQNQQSCLWKQTAAHKTPGQGQHTGRAVSLWGW